MFGLDRRSPFEEMFRIQREVDRLFNTFWSDLPERNPQSNQGTFQVTSDDEGWRIEVPMPGIDPEHVMLEAAGNTLNIRAEVPGEGRNKNAKVLQYEQSLALPQFLDLDKISASNRHGMLTLRIPLKESVKPRRIAIENVGEERKQLTSAGA